MSLLHKLKVGQRVSTCINGRTKTSGVFTGTIRFIYDKDKVLTGFPDSIHTENIRNFIVNLEAREINYIRVDIERDDLISGAGKDGNWWCLVTENNEDLISIIQDPNREWDEEENYVYNTKEV